MPEAASLEAATAIQRLATRPEGLDSEEAARRLAAVGPNALRTHHAQALAVLVRQFRSALLLLLVVTAVVSGLLGERTGATVIGAILAVSVGLGFFNEYRAERAVEALHEGIRHDAPALRDGRWVGVEVTELVPGDVVRVDLGMIVPADLRILEAVNLEATTVFARVSPEQKARIIRMQRLAGRDVGFLGDGVNDALALHEADVGISVDSAVDVAKDAADVVLLEKDLGVLADGVVEGRRTFANTIKYVLMGTSSNFGNMFSAAGASAFLSFLPMLPSQILLNNLLYDAGELTIPTDSVDEELLERPSRWDIGFIERFMLVFGPASSLFDFATFALMLGVFHAGAASFRSGWFVESVCTQTLVIFVIRTRRVPFLRSRPSRPLLVASLTTAGIGPCCPAPHSATCSGSATCRRCSTSPCCSWWSST